MPLMIKRLALVLVLGFKMELEAILSNYEALGYEIITPELVEYLIDAWRLNCQSTHINVESVTESVTNTHLYLIRS